MIPIHWIPKISNSLSMQKEEKIRLTPQSSVMLGLSDTSELPVCPAFNKLLICFSASFCPSNQSLLWCPEQDLICVCVCARAWAHTLWVGYKYYHFLLKFSFSSRNYSQIVFSKRNNMLAIKVIKIKSFWKSKCKEHTIQYQIFLVK